DQARNSDHVVFPVRTGFWTTSKSFSPRRRRVPTSAAASRRSSKASSRSRNRSSNNDRARSAAVAALQCPTAHFLAWSWCPDRAENIPDDWWLCPILGSSSHLLTRACSPVGETMAVDGPTRSTFHCV